MKNKMKMCLPLVFVVAMIPTMTYALTKDETIYSTLNKDGSLFKTTVVTHLYNQEQEEIEDITKLKEILNINGNEKFTVNGEKVNWQSKGNEIFYQGSIEKDLPIQTEIKYYLDGKELEEKELEGKKGTVKIEIHFENTDSHEVYVDGNTEKLYTPFVVTLGTIISNKNASNIEITNGKIINTGSKNFIVGLSSPGLYESLELEELKDMDTITITYDTKSYKENIFYLVATPKLMDISDLDVFDKLDNLYSNVDSLQSNMNKIEEGSNKILEELESKINMMSSASYQVIDENTMNQIRSLAIKETRNGVVANEEVFKNQVIDTLNHSEELNPSNIAYFTLNTVSGDANLTNSILQYTNSCSSSVTDMFRNEVISNTASNDEILMGIAMNMGMVSENTPVEYYESIAESVAFKLIEGCDSYNTAYLVASQELEGLKQTIPEVVYQAILEAASNTASNVSESVALNVANTYTLETISSLTTLKEAINTLNTGISSYNRDGIRVLSSYAYNMRSYTNKLEELSKLIDNYKGFGSDNATTTTFVSVIK